MRFAVDTGGTFTDLVVDDDRGCLRVYKSSTTPRDPIVGVFNVLDLAANDHQLSLKQFLRRGTVLVHATTRSINAILTGATARTALLTTEGHPDILVYREGGRTEPFNFTRSYPEPYVPRSLTFEVTERVGVSGEVVKPLDEHTTRAIISQFRDLEVEAVAVCLLWSMANPIHELRIGQLLDEYVPDIPHTLSHTLNPTIREYRRASSTAIDASLKPLMRDYFRELADRLASAGFLGRVLVVTSNGGVLDVETVSDTPIHTIGSGPAMAPVAGRHFAQTDASASTAIVADTGGTSFDVSLVRRGRIPVTRDTWLGAPYFGHMTGFASVDVKSIGAGGGSIAWVDQGGLLHVGPQSAGSDPGPICYERGGTQPTLTDACLVLGYLDPGFFLGGALPLNADPAATAIEVQIAHRLELDLHEASASIIRLATEHMVRAIEEITLNQGIDPTTAVLVGGGGAAGLTAVAIARRLGCSAVIIPAVGAVLSAAGALMSDLTTEFSGMLLTTSSNFDFYQVNSLLAELESRCHDFAQGPGSGAVESSIELSAEARYPHQIWELDVPLQASRFSSVDHVEQLRQDFHTIHEDLFAISDPGSPIEIVGWRARIRCSLRTGEFATAVDAPVASTAEPPNTRGVYFPGPGLIETRVIRFEALVPGDELEGPAIVESPVTTVVLDAEAFARRTPTGSLIIHTGARRVPPSS